MIVGSTTAGKLTKLLKAEFASNTSRTSWGGKGVVIEWNRFRPTNENKIHVNEQGTAHGCHTCDSRLENDTDQPWVGDHFPPTELRPFARAALDEALGLKDNNNKVHRLDQILRPQCHACSNQQAAAVKQLNNLGTKDKAVLYLKNNPTLRDKWAKLIVGHSLKVLSNTSTSSSGPSVTTTEGDIIQQLGVTTGCHSDNTHKVAGGRYHADHIWPQELCTSYMSRVLEKLGLSNYMPTSQELRPQCPRCSASQGGKMKQIAALALAYAEMQGIQNYKVESSSMERTEDLREAMKRKRDEGFMRQMLEKEEKKKNKKNKTKDFVNDPEEDD